jgi:hypothetical protein
MQGTSSVLAVTRAQDRLKGEGAGIDGMRGVTVGRQAPALLGGFSLSILEA